MILNLRHPEPPIKTFGGKLREGSLKEFLLGVFLVSCFLFSSYCYADAILPQVCDLGNCVTVEVVTKDADMARGLMYRTSLGEDKGMLFAFNFDDYHQFWMKNMHFSLDMLWISLDGHIVYLGQGIPACTSDPCTVYTPDQKARYVLELNNGYTTTHHWKLGDKLDLKGI